MMTISKKLAALLFVGVLLVSAAACKKDSQGEGPAEQAGKKIDQATERASQEIGKALERGGETVKTAGEDLQKEKGK